MNETVRAERWLFSRLSGDGGAGGLNTLVGGRIYAYVAPQGVQSPLVVYSYQSGYDVRGVGPTRVMASLLYQIKAVGVGTTPQLLALQSVADRIDWLLQAASGTVADGRVLVCVREGGVSYIETDNSVVYTHLGGLYRLLVRAL